MKYRIKEHIDDKGEVNGFIAQRTILPPFWHSESVYWSPPRSWYLGAYRTLADAKAAIANDIAYRKSRKAHKPRVVWNG